MKSIDLNNNLIQQFDDCITLFSNSKPLIKSIIKSSKLISSSLKNKHKIVSFGNGGSAADAQHFAAEFIGRFQK